MNLIITFFIGIKLFGLVFSKELQHSIYVFSIARSTKKLSTLFKQGNKFILIFISYTMFDLLFLIFCIKLLMTDQFATPAFFLLILGFLEIFGVMYRIPGTYYDIKNLLYPRFFFNFFICDGVKCFILRKKIHYI